MMRIITTELETASSRPESDLLPSKSTQAPVLSLWGIDAASVEWRRQQAHVDADIESLARDPSLERQVAEWDRAGLSPADQRERLAAYFKGGLKIFTAAE